MLGETYDRFIAGDAVSQKSSPLYLPDDGQFHGIGKRAQYKMDSYWDTNHVSTSEKAFNRFPCRSLLACVWASGFPPSHLWENAKLSI